MSDCPPSCHVNFKTIVNELKSTYCAILSYALLSRLGKPPPLATSIWVMIVNQFYLFISKLYLGRTTSIENDTRGFYCVLYGLKNTYLHWTNSLPSTQDHGLYSIHQSSELYCDYSKTLGFSGSGGGHVNDLRFRVYVRPAVFKFSDDVILVS